MRKLVYPLFVAGALFLAACGGEKKADATAETTDSSATASTEAAAAPADEATASTEEASAPAESSTPSSSSKSTGSKKEEAPTSTPEEMPAKNIIGTAMAMGHFSELAAAVTATGLGQTLGNPGPFTLFAPNDEAFAKIDPTAKANYFKPENKQKLINLIKLHVTNGNNTIESLVGPKFATFNGKTLEVKKAGKGYTVGKANVVKANIKATNGMIHEIDAVLIPADY